MQHPPRKSQFRIQQKNLGISRAKAHTLNSQQIKQLNKVIIFGFATLSVIALLHALITN